MKRVLVFLGVLVSVSIITGVLMGQQKPSNKKYKVELTIDEWKHVFATIEMSKAKLKISDIPSKDVTFINDSLFDKIQSVFVNQINAQLAAEKPKPEVKKDSTNNKKK